VPKRHRKHSRNAGDLGAAAGKSLRAWMRRCGRARRAVQRAGLLGLLAAWCIPSSALGETPDFEAGRAVMVGGEDGSITPCFMCHGLDGVGDFAGAFPR